MLQPRTQFVLTRMAPALGFLAALTLIVASALLYNACPSRPRPWNRRALIAIFNGIGTEGADQRLVFYYDVENRTGEDYRLPDHFEVTVTSKLKDGSLNPTNGSIKSDDDLFVPVGVRVRYAIHTRWSCPDLGSNQTDNALAACAGRSAPDLGGFVVFDERNRYEIELPKGWPSTVAAPVPEPPAIPRRG
jgi:hypothetical protein